MRKLLVPVDNSPGSMRAVAHAIHLATENGPLSLVFMHAHEKTLDHARAAAYAPLRNVEAEERHETERVLKAATDAATAAGVTFSTLSAAGDPAHAIVAAADRERCDGIIMGTRGMGTVVSLMMGSVATKVVHLAHVPVTLVK